MNRTLGFLEDSAVKVARELIGCQLFVIEKGGAKTGGTIIETEAYNQDDAASHSYRGQTPRTEVMFGPAGHIYVYFTYGMHWCMNIVVGPKGRGEAVLIRAILPEQGLDQIRKRRGNKPDRQLANGPAKVCQALRVTGKDNGQKLGGKRFVLEPPVKKYKVMATKRIGITKDTHRLWRFVAIT
jgi:DNA-3-methyladenine glycosylase